MGAYPENMKTVRTLNRTVNVLTKYPNRQHHLSGAKLVPMQERHVPKVKWREWCSPNCRKRALRRGVK